MHAFSYTRVYIPLKINKVKMNKDIPLKINKVSHAEIATYHVRDFSRRSILENTYREQTFKMHFVQNKMF